MASLFTNPLQRTACLLAAPPTAQSSTLKHALIRSPLRQISTSPSLRLIPKSSPKPELSQQPQASPLLSEEDDGPIHVHFNPYKTKKTWPPDFSKLSQRYQLRLERKYRRRMKLKFARPVWTKATILLQWGAAGCKFPKVFPRMVCSVLIVRISCTDIRRFIHGLGLIAGRRGAIRSRKSIIYM